MIEAVIAPVVIAALGGLTYGLLGYWKNGEDEGMRWKDLGITAFVGFVAGAAALLVPSVVGSEVVVSSIDTLGEVSQYFTTGFLGSVIIIQSVKGLIKRTNAHGKK